MLRTLVLVRHAKAAWPDDDTSDHDRPLTGRGRRNAGQIGRWLHDNSIVPDYAVVSSASRTRETYDVLVDELAKEPELHVTDDAYAAGAGDLLDLVRAVPAGTQTALLVAHNPGIGMLASLLDDESTNVPERQQMRISYRTSACALFEVDLPWAQLDPGTARLIAYTVPRD